MEFSFNSFITQTSPSSEIRKALKFIIEIGLDHEIVIKACNELGIAPDQIKVKPRSYFEEKNVCKEAENLRFQHYEARRRARLLVIAEFLIENNIYSTRENSKLLKSRSSASRNKQRSGGSLPIVSQTELSSRKLKIAKNQIIKRLKFEQNRKKIKEEEENSRRIMDQKIQLKLLKNERKESPQKKKFYEIHEKRIKDILIKKYKEQDEHELRALNLYENKNTSTKTNSFSIHSSPKRYLSDLKEEDIDAQLTKINSKLSHSAERAKKHLISKANSGKVYSSYVQNAKMTREVLETKREEENTKKLLKIQQGLLESSKRRLENILNQTQKRTRSTKAIEERRIEEHLKIEQEILEKERFFELKEIQREKVRSEIKESYERKSNFIYTKNQLRKKDQEENLKRINKNLEKFRKTKIEKFKDLESGCKNRVSIDFYKLRTKVEAEFRKSYKNN